MVDKSDEIRPKPAWTAETVSKINKFVKEHWVDVAIALGAVAAVVIGTVARIDLLHHIGSLSSNSIMHLAYGSAGALGGALGVRLILASYKKWAANKEKLATKVRLNEERSRPPNSEKEMHVKKLIAGNIGAKTQINIEALIKGSDIRGDDLERIADAAKRLEGDRAVSYVKEELNKLPPLPYTCILFQVGEEYVLKGKAMTVDFDGKNYHVHFFNGSEEAMRIPKENLKQKPPVIFMGTERFIDTFTTVENTKELLDIFKNQKTLRIIKLRMSELVKNQMFSTECQAFGHD